MAHIAQAPHLTFASGRVSGGIIPSCTALGLSAMGWPAVCGSMRSYGAGSDHECLPKCMHDCFCSVVSVSFANHSHIMATNTCSGLCIVMPGSPRRPSWAHAGLRPHIIAPHRLPPPRLFPNWFWGQATLKLVTTMAGPLALFFLPSEWARCPAAYMIWYGFVTGR